MYKVFANQCSLSFSQTSPASSLEISHLPSEKQELIALMDRWSRQEKGQHRWLKVTDPEQALADFLGHFSRVEAAGGVVFSEKNALLWIHRLGLWDLPKGKIENGESRREAAYREVREECGLHEVEVQQYLGTTYHYYFRDEAIIKPTYWYKMRASAAERLVPQKEEGIEHLAWKTLEESGELLEQTYPSIREIVQTVLSS